ncbi:type I polyketide synthase [Rhodococcus daqingensis]|uniref:Type I polyketide synthase n=1 Tax=Rhodococcus daqingensis TaxID=2479363 RepID=A0ABW2RYW9_9NOCA
MTDIAIVGLDCRFPQAANAKALWALLMGGGDGISEVPAQRWRTDDFYDPKGGPGKVNTRCGGFLDDADAFDPEVFGIAPREAEAMDPQQRLLLQAAWRALEDATLDPRTQAGSNTGVYVGVMANEWANLHLSDYSKITPQLGSGNGYFMTANRISYQLDLRGPSIAVDTACSSSLVAVHMACAALRAGECDQALAGGVNIILTPTLNIFYTQAGLSAPDGRCKPFSEHADGIGRGEGVAVLALRRLDDAQREGLPIYATIKGSAVNSDGRSNGITAPNRWAQQQVVGEAYRRAGVRPEQVAFLEAHGTGTVLGDMIEAKALGHVHAVPRPEPCAVGSIKGNLGHTEGAAGVAGLIKAALSLHHRVVPPSRGAEQENPRLRLADHGLRLLTEALPLPAGPAYGGVSSFGIGGTNAHLLLGSAPDRAPASECPGGGVLTVSSASRDGLRRNAARLADDLAGQPEGRLAQVCWSSNKIKSSGRHRLALPARGRDEAVAELRDLVTDDGRFAAATGQARAVSTGWLFTGQGSQYRGMSAALHAESGRYRRALAEVDEQMAPHLGRSIRELMLGGEDLDRTEHAQPAIFAVQYALAQTLTEAGAEPSWLLGHSVGEYAAAALAGVFGLDDACRLVVARGRLMQRLPAGGGMLAVRTGEDEVADMLAGEPLASVAAVNGPRDLVLSGAAEALGRVADELAVRAVPVRPLAVSHAFHSPLMEPMVDAFAAVAAGCSYEPPRIPVYSTLHGRLLGAEEPMDADYWTEHVRGTVLFADALAAGLEARPTHLIELGPRRVLAPLVSRANPDLACLVPCPGPDATGRELTGVVAALYRDGHNPNWDALYEPAQRVRLTLGGYEFDTTHRYWAHQSEPEPSADPLTSPTLLTEDDTMDNLISLFREQTALLAAAGQGRPAPAGDAMAAASTAAAQSRVTTSPATPEAAGNEVAAIVYAEIARVAGHPVDTLRSSRTIIGDLGFDSIMVTDVVAGLTRTFPALTAQSEWFSPSGTVGDLVARICEQLGTVPAPADPGPAGDVAATQAAAAPAVTPDQIATENYRIEQFPEVKAIAERLALGEAHGLSNPYFLVNDGITRDTSIIGGEEVLNFSSYNYLGMSGHPHVVSAVQDAVGRYGSSCSASRLISGEKPLHGMLEAELAALLGTEDAIALVSGHATNVTVIGHLVGPGDLVIHDSLAHDSILQGCKLSGATRKSFPHNDHAALDAILTEIRPRYRRVLVLIEGVYSQDGDIPDLPAVIAVKRKHRALLMIDEAHSIGVLGATGGGIGEHFAVDRSDVELWSGTMSKALAGCGGYVAGSRELIQYLKYTTPGFIYSVGMTPSNAAASLAALRQMRAEPELFERLHRHSRLFLTLAVEAGLDTGASADTPIVPCIVGDSIKTLKLSSALLTRGINVNPILYPAVPEDQARLRFFVTSCHTEDQIRYTVKTTAEELALLDEGK